jgi:hypothetical protein
MHSLERCSEATVQSLAKALQSQKGNKKGYALRYSVLRYYTRLSCVLSSVWRYYTTTDYLVYSTLSIETTIDHSLSIFQLIIHSDLSGDSPTNLCAVPCLARLQPTILCTLPADLTTDLLRYFW